MDERKVKKNPDSYKKDPTDRVTGKEKVPTAVSSKREVVDYKLDNTDPEKIGKTQSEVSTAIDKMAKTISPDILAGSEKDITNLRASLNTDLADTIKSSKSRLNNISNLLSKQISGNKSKDPNELKTDKKTEFDLEATNVNTSILLKQFDVNNKAYTTLLRTEIFNKTITSVYYRKSLEYQYSHLEVSKKILAATKSGFNKLENAISHDIKNSGLPDYVKMKDFEFVKSKAKGRLADAILDKSNEVIDKYKNGDEEATASGGKKPSKLGTLAIGFLGAQLSKTAIGKTLIDYTKNLIDDPSTALKVVSKKVGKEYDNVYLNAMASRLSGGLTGLANILGTDVGNAEISGLDSKRLNDPATLDKKTMITKNEVVTGYLSKILKELTMIRTGKGESEVEDVKFNYETRSFSTSREMKNSMVSKINKSMKKAGIATDVTGIAKFILNASAIPYGSDVLTSAKTGLTSYMLSDGNLNINKLPEGFYSYFNPETAMLLEAGISNLTASEDRADSVNTIRDAFNAAKSKMPDMTKMVNKQVGLGNTELLSSAGIINLDATTGKYSINKDMYNKKMISEVLSDDSADALELDKDTTGKTSILDRIRKRKIESVSEVQDEEKSTLRGRLKEMMPDMTKMVNKQDDIVNYITGLKDSTVESITKKGSKTIEVLRSTITTVLDKLDITKYLKSDLTPAELLHSFTLLESITNSVDLKGRLLIYLHSVGKVSDEALESVLKSIRMAKMDNPSKADELLATIDSNKDVRAINNLNRQREENSNKEIKIEDVEERIVAKEDKRIESIVTNVVKKLGLGKTSDNDQDKDGERDGSWMSRVLGKGKVDSTDLGKGAEAMPKGKGEKSSPIWKILGLLGMGIPMIIKYVMGVADSIGWIWNIVKGAGGFLTGLVGSIISGVGSAIGSMKDILVGGFNLVTGAITTAFGAVKDLVGSGIDKAKSALGFGDDDSDKKDKDKKTDKKKDGKKSGKAGAKTATKTATKTTTKTVAKTVGKSALKKVPLLGIAAGTAFAANELSDGNLGYAAGEFASGLLGSIPIIGTALSLGIDGGMEWYKARNPEVDKNLYDGKTYPNMDADTADQITLNHIRQYETGTASGKYDLASDIGDGAGISFGTYQFTEKSGNLKEYIKRVSELTNDPTGKALLENFEGNNYTGNKTGLIRYLKETGATNAGRYVQDSMYKELFMDPAKQLAASYNITDKASISQIIDHSVNAGLGGAKRMLQRAGGDYSPENIARSRKIDYNGIIDGNAKLSKYRDGWYKRVDGMAKAFNTYTGDITLEPKNTTVENPALTAIGVPPEVTNPINKEASKLSNNDNSLATKLTTTPPSPDTVKKATDTYQPTSTSENPITPNSIAPVLNTDSLEKLLGTSNKHLSDIAGNTTRMISNDALILGALNEIKKALTTPPPKSNTNNVSQMTKGVSVKG